MFSSVEQQKINVWSSGKLSAGCIWLSPGIYALLYNFCFMTISFLNCFGDKSCCVEGCCCLQNQWSFISCKMCIMERNIYLRVKIAEGNPMLLYQLLLPNSVVKIHLNCCQVFAVSHFPVQPSRYAEILITR